MSLIHRPNLVINLRKVEDAREDLVREAGIERLSLHLPVFHPDNIKDALLYPPIPSMFSDVAGSYTNRLLLPHKIKEIWTDKAIRLRKPQIIVEQICVGAHHRVIAEGLIEFHRTLIHGTRISAQYNDLPTDEYWYFVVNTQYLTRELAIIRVGLYTCRGWRVPAADFILELPRWRCDVVFPKALAHYVNHRLDFLIPNYSHRRIEEQARQDLIEQGHGQGPLEEKKE
ncbi:hypothetical protein CPB83DRAFT_837893 [Crepidotus variabilis]|uniref:Uncharacterized protein n=1 Tax=Crepidotus variabilis TaxID=179855 RepID=A0A9P6JM68_9AGAR|nr:hypothetical protein CPB83DRAFT_837893 [Crepidotus variabilis]